MVYSIKLETNVSYDHEYPHGYDDANFFSAVKKSYETMTFPLKLTGRLELGHLYNDFVGLKIENFSFNTFNEFMKWLKNSVWSLNSDWTR